METQNEQKANEIVDKFYGNFVPFHAHSKAFEECAKAKNAVLDAMEWKDKQFAQEKQQLIGKAESVCAEMFLRIESELFNAGVKNTNNRKEIEDALEIGYKYFKQAMKGE